MKKFSIGLALVLLVFNAFVVSAYAQETIDFESFSEGDIVSQVFGDGFSGPILVNGVNPNFPGENAAMIYDSSCPPRGVPADCSDDDPDLGTPNEIFGGPGVGAGGAAGPNANTLPKGNLLIVSEDLNSEEPDDADVPGATLSFDFSAYGSVTVVSIFIIDVEADETGAQVSFFDADNNPISTVNLPDTGDNGVATTLLNVAGVVRMEVLLNGSGAIDDIVFIPAVPDIKIVKEVSVDGGMTYDDANNPASAPTTWIGGDALYRLTVENTGQVDLEDVVINDAELEIENYFVGNLAAGEEEVLTSNEIPQLNQPGRCQEPGDVTNIATVSGDPVVGGDPVTDSDPAVVRCVPPPCEYIGGTIRVRDIKVFESTPCSDIGCGETTQACELFFEIVTRNQQTYNLYGEAYGTALNLALLKAWNEDLALEVSLCWRFPLYDFEIVWVNLPAEDE